MINLDMQRYSRYAMHWGLQAKALRPQAVDEWSLTPAESCGLWVAAVHGS